MNNSGRIWVNGIKALQMTSLSTILGLKKKKNIGNL